MSSTQQLLLTEGGGAAPNYIEDVFSTYLYNGNGSTQTITNNIDLSTKGGMVWSKARNLTGNNVVCDTDRGATKAIFTNLTNATITSSGYVDAFTTTGYSVGSDSDINNASKTYASWTFRKQPKFFDVVTYTGNGTAGRTVAHSLGSVPGCVIVKQTSSAGNNWKVYHRSLGGTKFINLSATTAAGTDIAYWNNTDPTSTVFTVGDDSSVNANGSSYVAYIFAHDAGGFGLTGTDNVISCGSYVGDGTTKLINVGFEPQWILIKNASSGTAPQADWRIVDNMRGFTATGNSAILKPNLSDAETNDNPITIASQGFNTNNMRTTGDTYIYIAIRRGPMKVPTDGTKVFTPALGVSTTPNMVAGFPVDSFLGGDRDTPTSTNWKWWDRLRGNVASLLTTTTAAEDTSEFNYGQFQSMTGFISGNYDASDKIGWSFRRAPSFFDEVCYTGTGSAQNLTHNLGIAPEMIITKARNGAVNWNVYHSAVGATKAMVLNTTAASTTATSFWNDTAPTSSVFTVGTANGTNASGNTYVAYLFATCAGVSKVNSYTGNGSTQTINCGFAGGARFVLIKRTDSTGDWYVYDTARGMTTLTDPYLLLNSTAAESATLGSVTTTTGGFTVNASILAAINASGGSYIYLAVA